MESPDEAMPLTLPDTQNADDLMLTQSQEVPKPPTVWGRLCPNKNEFPKLKMLENSYSLGRLDSCSINLSKCNLNPKYLSVISKIHFRIVRETLDNGDKAVYLEDLSHNSTYVNEQRVGKGNRIMLENNDIIALAQPFYSVYTYMGINEFEGSGLPPVLKSKYAVSRKLGAGACGEVKLVYSKSGNKRFAMKMIQKKSFTISDYTNAMNDPDKIMNEVRILKALRHPFIIRMEEIIDTPSTVYIVLELMEGGELFDRIKNASDCGLTEKCAKFIFYQVVQAVYYLHERGITHRDLKPENILLASNQTYPLVKVSDFGLSKLVHTESIMRTFCGTPMYVAPEVLVTSGKGCYTNQVDVWSLGVILYVCLSGRVPFTTNSNEISLQEQIIKGLYRFPAAQFSKVSKKAQDLIKRMLTVDPKKRITIRQVLSHPWLQDHDMREQVSALATGIGDDNLLVPFRHHNKRVIPPTQNGHVFGPPGPVPKRTRHE